jgi:serine/threonine protein kinase
LVLARRLALAVQALHRQGRIHRSLDAATVTVDGQFSPQLPPLAGPCRFGGERSDPEVCPPELAQGPVVDVPAEIEAAAAILRERAVPIDARRIDIYQLGVLLCQLLTGERFLNYLYSPTCKAKVPPMARVVLESCLGENRAGQFVDCGNLIASLDDLIRQLPDVQATSTSETPSAGSVMVIPSDTPPHGKSAVSPALTPVGKNQDPNQYQKLPFERLGHFRIVEQIGHGGMGDVYRGYDESLDRYVAIKVLPAELARDEDFVRRFQAEATAVAKVAHPNVVPIHFIGQDAGYQFFAMQYIEGESLAERLARQKRLPVEQAVEIIGQCLTGLEAAHRQGLVHRDIKPNNVLLEASSGRAMLVDFGLVRRIDGGTQHTATGVVMGTVDYIAPEQARGQPVDGRTDIYSLGVMFYQLLAGRLPFQGDTPTTMIFQHAYEKPFPLEQAAPDVPPPLVGIIVRMMAKEPDSRYTDCAAVLADITAYRQDNLRWPACGRAVGGEDGDGEDVVFPPAIPFLPQDTPWQRARDWAATMFCRYAPEQIHDLQSTTQQMDAAVAHYQRRRDRLANLLEEARGLESELSRQEVEDLESQLNKANARLAQLRSQRDLLEARGRLEGGLRRPRRHRWWLPVAGTAALAVSISWLLVAPRKAFIEPSAAAVSEQRADIVGSQPYLDALADIARQKGISIGNRFNQHFDQWLPAAKGHVLLVETHDGTPIVPLSVLEKFYLGASDGLKAPDGIATIEDTTIVFVDFSALLKGAIIGPAGAGGIRRQVFIVGNSPYWQTLADMAKRNGMTVSKSFSYNYDQWLQLAKGHILLVETHDGIPIVPLPALDKVYSGASDGLRTPDRIATIGDTRIVFVDFSRLLSTSKRP